MCREIVRGGEKSENEEEDSWTSFLFYPGLFVP